MQLKELDRPSTLDLIFTMHKIDIKDMEYYPPLGKSGLVVIKQKTLYRKKNVISMESKREVQVQERLL